MEEVASLLKDSERPVRIRFVRQTEYFRQQQREKRDREIDRQKQQQPLLPENKKPTTVGTEESNRSLRDVLNILSPEILSDSVNSDDDNDDNHTLKEREEETHEENQARVRAESLSNASGKKWQVVDTNETSETTVVQRQRSLTIEAQKHAQVRRKNPLHACLVRAYEKIHVPAIGASIEQNKDATELESPTGIVVPIGKSDAKMDVSFATRNVVPPSNGAGTEEGTVDATNTNHVKHAPSISNDKTKKSEIEPDRPLQAVSIAHISQQSVVSDIQNVAHTSGPTATKTLTTSEETLEPVGGGSKFDMFPDAVLTEQEEEEFPLHSCVKFGFLDFLEEELQKDTTGVNAIDSRGRTALDLAALTGQLTLVTRLRKAGGIFQYKNGPRMLALANNRSRQIDKYLKCVRSSAG